MKNSGILLALTSYPNDGRKLKGFIMGMVKSRIALCVQRINYVKSYYMWEGDYTRSEEKVLLIKCVAANKEKLVHYIEKHHPYEIPELIFVDPVDVGEKYMERILRDKTKAGKGKKGNG